MDDPEQPAEALSDLDPRLMRVSPPIADLLQRMMASGELTWSIARGWRDEIVALNHTAQSEDEHVALLFAFKALMDNVEELGLLDAEGLAHLKRLRRSDYLAMLNVQGMVGDHIDPDRLDHVTRREVEAGRMAPDDDFRQFAEDGAVVLGKRHRDPKRPGWLKRLLGQD